ncbi:MAG: VWA domain-containing protein [Gemmatimonadota bacterium]|nr:VWA domain-containing protein [Gemmatimonadota bacterium]
MTLEFARPWALLLLALLPLYVVLLRRTPRGGLVLGRADALGGLQVARWRAWIPQILRGLVWVVLVLALAGPRRPSVLTDTRAEGIGIMIAMDISSSMLAEDFRPANRLEVAKRTTMRFIQGRKNDRIGLVAFAGEALTQVPVTLDYDLLFSALGNLRPGLLEDGTAIGMGLATAASRLRATPGPSRVVILLSDGENNRGEIAPLDAARAAAAYDIRVFTIGVGSAGMARVPIARGPTGLVYGMLPVSIDEPLLTEIARITGGRYYRATDAQALSQIFAEIDRLVRTPVEVQRYVEYAEYHLPLILLGAALLVAEWLVRGSRWSRVP